MAKDKNRNNFTGRNPNNPSSNTPMNNENPGTNSDQTAVDSGAAAGAASQPGTETLQSGTGLGAGAAGAEQGVQSSSDAGQAGGASGGAVSEGVQGAGTNDAPAVGGVAATPVVSGPVVSEADLAAEAVVRQAYEQPAARGFVAPIHPIDEAAFVEVQGPAISQHAKGLLEEFHNYVEAMDPKRPIAQVAGAAHQRRLFTILRSIINSLEGEDFQVVFGQVLATFEAQAKGVFHDLSVFRFFDARELNMTTPDRLAFRNLLSFLIKIAPVKSRHLVAQQVNMDAHFGHAAFTEEGRQRVQNFCNIR